MRRSKQQLLPLSEAELEVLKILWDAGPSPAAVVRDVINAGGREWAYTTTKTILGRLEEKGYAARNREVFPHVFTATVDVGTLAGMRLREVRRELFGGRRLPLLRALLDSTELCEDEIGELRRYLDELEKPSQRGDAR